MSGAKCRTSPPQTTTGRLRPFQHLTPHSVEEAVEALQSAQGTALLLAGGTDLVPMMKVGAIAPQILISMNVSECDVALVCSSVKKVRRGLNRRRISLFSSPPGECPPHLSPIEVR